MKCWIFWGIHIPTVNQSILTFLKIKNYEITQKTSVHLSNEQLELSWVPGLLQVKDKSVAT